MNQGLNLANDEGNTAIEVLLVVLVGGVLTVAFALQAFSAQKASFAAQQLARQVVRLETLGEASDQLLVEMSRATAANLHISAERVTVRYSKSGAIGTAVTSVAGESGVARMRLGE